jgi:hypothetical protein
VGVVCGGQELKSVAEAVIEVEAPVAREARIGLQVDVVGVQLGGQAVQVLDEDAGGAMRAGRKSSSTPRCSSSAPARNQTPPRAANAAGLAISARPSTPA